MLRVTIELLPGGRESEKRVIGTADIARVNDGLPGALADYRVALNDAVLGEVGGRAIVRRYPRWAGSVWDLVARCLAAALNQDTEALPPRPAKPEVTVRTNDAGFRYVRLDEIPEPARTFFDQKLSGSGIPDHGCAYALAEYDGKMKRRDWHTLPAFPRRPGADGKGEGRWVRPETIFDQLPTVLHDAPLLPGEEARYVQVLAVIAAAQQDPALKRALIDEATRRYASSPSPARRKLDAH